MDRARVVELVKGEGVCNARWPWRGPCRYITSRALARGSRREVSEDDTNFQRVQPRHRRMMKLPLIVAILASALVASSAAEAEVDEVRILQPDPEQPGENARCSYCSFFDKTPVSQQDYCISSSAPLPSLHSWHRESRLEGRAGVQEEEKVRVQ